MRAVGVILGIAVLATGVLLGGMAALNMLAGWLLFLFGVLPNVSPDWPTVGVSLTALALFVATGHLVGKGFRRDWKPRWTLSLAGMLFVMFTAGTAMIAVVHQVGWLATSEEPLRTEQIRGSNPHNELKNLSIAVHNYTDVNDTFPPGGTFTEDGRMLHGWATHLLPYIPYDARAIDMSKPWTDPVHRDVFRSVLPAFLNSELEGPPIRDEAGYGLNHYAANRRVFPSGQGLPPVRSAETILFGEVNAGFKPWGHPLNTRDPAIGLNRSPHGFGGSPGSGGVHFAMGDGSVRFVNDDVSPEVLRALATPP